MSLLELAVEGYRWLVGIALVILMYNVMKKLLTQPFKDENALDEPDYMIKVHWVIK